VSAFATAREGDILVATLDHPPLNEIGWELADALHAFGRLLGDGADGARAVLLHSARPGGFSAGADLRALHAGLLAEPDPDRARARIADFLTVVHAAFDAIDGSPVPVVGALHGVVMGGGFELALCCDVLVADRSARFGFPELRLGLVPGFGGLPRLARDVGNAVARDLLFTGRTLGAERAHGLGVVGHLVARGEAYGAALALARQMAGFDPEVVAAAKAFAKPIPHERLEQERALFLRLVGEPRVREALAAFVADRGPRPYLRA
jgi:enoyl-CoA hydratase/carnithine racemase